MVCDPGPPLDDLLGGRGDFLPGEVFARSKLATDKRTDLGSTIADAQGDEAGTFHRLSSVGPSYASRPPADRAWRFNAWAVQPAGFPASTAWLEAAEDPRERGRMHKCCIFQPVIALFWDVLLAPGYDHGDHSF